MSKTLTVLKHEFKQTVKRKSFIITTVSLPLLLFLGYGIYEGVQHWHEPSEPRDQKIGYVDEVGTFDAYTEQYDITFVSYSSEEKAKDALLTKEIQEYFVIPADYVSSGCITRYISKSELEVPGKVWRGMEDFLLSNLLADKVSARLLQRVNVPIWLNTVELDESGEIAAGQNEATKVILPIAFGLLFAFAIFFSSGLLLESVSEEKENRVIEIILSSVSPRQLLAGKIVGLGAAGLVQLAIWLSAIKVFTVVAKVSIPILSELAFPASLLLLGLAYFLIGYLLFASLYAGVGSIGSTTREAQSLSMMIVMPAILPLMFNFLMISNPDGAFAKALTFFPLTGPIAAMMRLSRDAMSAWEITLSLAILAASVVLAMWAAAKAFRVFVLMYGKTPTLKEIVRNIREV